MSSNENGDDEDAVELDPRFLEVPSLLPGDLCQTNRGAAQVRYVGVMPGMPKGFWVGLQYEDKVGKNDGMVNGRRYFRCPPGHGGFLRATKVTKLESPDSRKQPSTEDPIATRVPAAGADDLSGGGAVATGGIGSNEKPRGESLASNIARRRQESSKERTARALLTGRQQGGITLEEWHRDIAPARGEAAPTPDKTYATGPELSKVVVGSLAQFTIITHGASGDRVESGGSHLAVVMRGLTAPGGGSQPVTVRTKIIDRGDGTYICEFRPYLTGVVGVWITLDNCNIHGSPYELAVITQRPNASQCVVRGEALRHAIARTPMKFDVLFVDEMGHPSQAEDLDVYVEPAEEAEDPPEGDAIAVDDASDPIDSTDGGVGVSAQGEGSPGLPTGDGDPSDAIRDGAFPAEQRTMAADTAAASGYGERTKYYARARSPRVGMLDAPTRQRHLQLWQSRQSADKTMARLYSTTLTETVKKKDRGERPAANFSHEMSMDRLGFAFGGVDPGTLHAHGKLVKVHSVHYSVGLAGRYKLHVGLRQQNLPLPGSPFELLVEPGKAYAASSKLPAESLPLSGIASSDWQHGLIFRTADMLSNVCTKGGSNILMKHGFSSKAESTELACDVVDRGDGTYELKWKCNQAGVFPIDVLMDGAQVVGSPTELLVRSAKPDVEQMTVSGDGISMAIAGIEAMLHVRIADCFGNNFDAVSGDFPYHFGLILNASVGQQLNDKADKKIKQVKGNEKADGPKKTSVSDEKKASSIPFEGKMNGSVYEIRYVAQEAGTMDLHAWAATMGSGEDLDADKSMEVEHRVPLPGSPFTVQVSEGEASATGSFVGEAEAGKQGAGFVAGEHVILRPQVRDPFGNASTPIDGALTAEHVKPGGPSEGPRETLPPPKLKGSLGSYEVTVEPTKAGLHSVHILLNGEDMSGSPVSFSVIPAAPSSSKCKLSRQLPPENEPLIEKQPIAIIATLFDKYGNQLDHGGVRVDAKASGVGVSGARVEDNKDGTYTISLIAGPPGEVKVVVRIDGNDLPPYLLTVVRGNTDTSGVSDAVGDSGVVPGVTENRDNSGNDETEDVKEPELKDAEAASEDLVSAPAAAAELPPA